MTGVRGDTITLAPELAKAIKTLNSLPPWERAVGALNMAAELREGREALLELRRAARAEMRDQGMTPQEVADLTTPTPSTGA